MQLRVSIISSRSGGTPGETDSYDRATTIRRIQQAIEAIALEHVPPGQISKVKAHVQKSGRDASGIRATTLEFKVVPGDSFSDVDRGAAIRACQAAVPWLVTSNVPADHLCSLVIVLKD